MCPPGYHDNSFIATHALGHMMYGCMSCHKDFVVLTGRGHCFHDYIYVCIYISFNTFHCLFNSFLLRRDGF